MSTPIGWLLDRGLGVVVFCGGAGCNRGAVYIPAEQVRRRFRPDQTCDEVSRLMKCGCGAQGRDGKIQVTPSSLDAEDVRHGRPPGTTEAERVRKAAERLERDIALHERMGWPTPR